jgi:hypothetical protein
MYANLNKYVAKVAEHVRMKWRHVGISYPHSFNVAKAGKQLVTLKY